MDDRKFKKIQKIVENILASKANQSSRRNLMHQIIEIASENKLSNVIGKMIKPMVDSDLPQLESLPDDESGDDEAETSAAIPTLDISKNMKILPASCDLLNRLLRDLKSHQQDGLENPIESHDEIKNLTSNLECFLFPFLLNKTRPKFNLLYDHCKKYTE